MLYTASQLLWNQGLPSHVLFIFSPSFALRQCEEVTLWTKSVRFLSSSHFSPFNRSGSLLLDSLKEHISTTAQDHCKAIYLHVLTTNNTAIHFYENRDFRQHHYLPYYYSIRGVLKDGFTYVLYINGGYPPWTILYPFMYRKKRCQLLNIFFLAFFFFFFTWLCEWNPECHDRKQIVFSFATDPGLFRQAHIHVITMNQLPVSYFHIFLNHLFHWLYPAYWINISQPEPLLHPSEAVPPGPVSAAVFSPLVQHCLQDRHTVQQNHVIWHSQVSNT